jgi:hypothetical protein
MMKQFRRNRYGVRASDREVQDEITRELDSCAYARASWADTRAPLAAIVAAGSVVIAAIALRVIEVTGGHNRDGAVAVR